MTSNFIDYVKINLKSGNGGKGFTHFRREKFVDKGGPDGGDGGRGGHIILRGNKQLWTLIHLKYQKHIKADHGETGGKSKSSGKQGKDVYIDVPLGTIAKNPETGEKMAEIIDDGQEVIILPGGMGGLGNYHFKTSTNQAPEYSQPGIAGQEIWVILELKLLADIGLVGFPNAGKSTLLSTISAARPEIGDYPFTTLVPNLGVVQYRDFKSFVMADIPGIIEGASEGKGLGLRFLRHIERNSNLLFLIDSSAPNPLKEYKTLVDELEKFNPELLDKGRILAFSKLDLINVTIRKKIEKKLPSGLPYVFFSSKTGEGILELKDLIWNSLNEN
ncbi:MAG: GTPase ObgE [Cytophagaceae bacterium]|nr:GTPase ObgE [Cytophagaceae bacterium]MBL0300832.1 GTPase ObgE [Cytophagaceae bacterium]MBL0327775.1 GTPase ObgE [Cytophagaceae bacterium]